MRIGAGRFRNALLPTAGPDVRPVPGRLRQSLFSILEPRLEGARVLDLCAGVGGLGLEALSRGAGSLVLVEQDRQTAAAIRQWVERRGLESEVQVVNADAKRGGWPPGPYDVVFLDPPFSVWEGPGSALPFLEKAIGSLDPGGIAAVKLPADSEPPEDSRWRVLDRRTQGRVAYLLLGARPP